MAQKAQTQFTDVHSDVFIPHPDTNPGERLLGKGGLLPSLAPFFDKAPISAKEDDDKKIATVEVWDSDSGEQDEWGSDMSQSGSNDEG